MPNNTLRSVLQDALWLILLALGTTLALALIIRLCGQNPADALAALAHGAFGSAGGLAATASRSVILLLYALGLIVSMRAGCLNIGAEGQSRVGAAAATACAAGALGGALAHLGWAGILLLLLAGTLGGALWALIAGALKEWRGVPEVISTLMLNFVALLLVRWLVRSESLLRGHTIFAQSDPLPERLRLAGWWQTEVHAGVLVALPAIVALHFFLFHTPRGFALRAMGLNPTAALACGIPVVRLRLFSFALAGGLAGFAGALGILSRYRLELDPTYPDYGYLAIAVALVANLKPLQVLPSALLFAGLEVGARSMEGNAGVSHDVIYLVEGMIIVAILIRGVAGARFKAGSDATLAAAGSAA